MMKDSIDFGNMEIPRLFRRLLIPTVLGMLFSAAFVITDGIFVGRGIGSDALAAVNITAPLFLINTGVGLMFGVGASVVASIHLSHGKVKTARINVTQAVAVSSLILAAYSLAVCLFAPEVARLLGCSQRLQPLVLEYMYWFVPFLPFSALLSSGMFFIRLDGSPNYAMWCNAVPALINIVLDYVFIFLLDWGMFGAALATSLGYVVGAAMILAYLSRRRNIIRFCRVKTSRKSLRLTRRNVGYMCRLGLSTFLCEGAIAAMMFTGNYVFIRHLGEDGVAAFSIACYFFPIIFMVYNAIGQSAQPILSYNFGADAATGSGRPSGWPWPRQLPWGFSFFSLRPCAAPVSWACSLMRPIRPTALPSAVCRFSPRVSSSSPSTSSRSVISRASNRPGPP